MPWRKLGQRCAHWLWEADIHSVSRGRALLLTSLRILAALGRDLAKGDLSLRATSLVYTTLLSLVPLLALSFSLLKALGVHNQLEPLLINFLAPLGEKGIELAQQLVQFVENVGVKVLGAVGLLLLLYTVLSLIQKIEEAFNATWRVTSVRPLQQRISGYLSVVLLGPLLMFSAVGITATVMNSAVVTSLLAIEPFGSLFYAFSQLLPYLLVSGAFTVTYVLIPNTRVKWRSALLGGLIAGVLWQEVGWLFTLFVVGSTKYTAIYSSFAIVILVLIWIYISWLILLLGSALAFYHQHPACQSHHLARLGQSSREVLAMEIMRRIAVAHYGQGQRWSLDSLAEDLRVPVDMLAGVIKPLEQHGLLTLSAEDAGFYLPGLDPSVISIATILQAVQGDGSLARRAVKNAEVWALFQQVSDFQEQQFGNQYLDALIADEVAEKWPEQQTENPEKAG